MYRTVEELLTDLNIATDAFKEDVESQINNDNYVASRMLSKAKKFAGKNIEVPLKYGREHTQSMSEYEQYNLQPRDILDSAYYDIRHLHGDMVLSKKKVDAQNVGKAQIIDLARTRMENLAETMTNYFSELLFTSVDDLLTTDPDSLIKLCATVNNIVGGINAATETRFSWNPKVLDYEGVGITFDNLIDPTSTYYVEKLLRRLIGPLTLGKDKPSVGLSTQGFWDAYEIVLRADKRFNDAYKADAGFDTLTFRSMKIAVDSHVPGGKMNQVATGLGMFLTLNEKYLGYRFAPKVRKWTPWKEAERQPIYFAMYDWMGNFVCSRRDRQGAIRGLPTDHDVYGTW